MLMDENFHIKHGQQWLDHFLQIAKISNKAYWIEPTGSTRELTHWLATLKVLDVGADKILII